VFVVGPNPPQTGLRVAVTPATATAPARFNVTVRNLGQNNAVGCSIAPDAPLAAKWSFQRVVGNVPQGALNEAFDIAPGQAVQLRLTIRPKPRFKATAAQIPIHAFCNNAAKSAREADNVITVSF
jgi:hypothetical protein